MLLHAKLEAREVRRRSSKWAKKDGWHFGLAGLLLLGQTEQFLAVPADGTAAISQQRYVALTFDDGPKRETTARLLDGLRERGASATFFLIGRQIPDQRDLVERMKAEGHQVGNHTWNHIRLATTSDPAVAEQEIQKTDTLLREILGDGTYWLRPPYGAIQDAQKPQISGAYGHLDSGFPGIGSP